MSHFIYATDCPHCKVQRASFTGSFIIPTSSPTNSRIPLSCPHCHEVVVYDIDHSDFFVNSYYQSNEKYNLNDLDSPVIILRHYPAGDVFEAPADVPERIGAVFIEAQENLTRGRFETCILLCGKVLDIATKDMDPAWKLERRLKKLSDDGKITSEMASWAEEIRLDRNDAVHAEGGFTKSDAEEIVGFTQAFLTYVFTLPALVNDRRTKRVIKELVG